jgi:hypothetical protein
MRSDADSSALTEPHGRDGPRGVQVTLRSGDDVVNSLEADTFSDSLKRYLSRELEDHLKNQWKVGRINVSSVETSSLCRVSVSNEGGSITPATESEEDSMQAAQDAFNILKADGGGGGGGNEAAPASAEATAAAAAAAEEQAAEAEEEGVKESESHDDLENMEAIRARFQTEQRKSLEARAAAEVAEAEASSPSMKESESHDDLANMEAIRARFQTEQREGLEAQASAAFVSAASGRDRQFHGAVQRMRSKLTPLSPETRQKSKLSLPALSESDMSEPLQPWLSNASVMDVSTPSTPVDTVKSSQL